MDGSSASNLYKIPSCHNESYVVSKKLNCELSTILEENCMSKIDAFECNSKGTEGTAVLNAHNMNFPDNFNRQICESNESLGIMSWVLDDSISLENLDDDIVIHVEKDKKFNNFTEIDSSTIMSPISSLACKLNPEESPIQLDKTLVIASTPKYECEFSYTFQEMDNVVSNHVRETVGMDNDSKKIDIGDLCYMSGNLNKTISYNECLTSIEAHVKSDRTSVCNSTEVKENLTPNIENELNRTWNVSNKNDVTMTLNKTFNYLKNTSGPLNSTALISEVLLEPHISETDTNSTDEKSFQNRVNMLNTTFAKENLVVSESHVNLLTNANFQNNLSKKSETYIYSKTNELNVNINGEDLNATYGKGSNIAEAFLIPETPGIVKSKAVCPYTQNVSKSRLSEVCKKPSVYKKMSEQNISQTFLKIEERKTNKSGKPFSLQQNKFTKRSSTKALQGSSSKLNSSMGTLNNLNPKPDKLMMRHSISGTSSTSIPTNKIYNGNNFSKVSRLKSEVNILNSKLLNTNKKTILDETISVPKKINLEKTVVKKPRKSVAVLPKPVSNKDSLLPSESKYKTGRLSLQIPVVQHETKTGGKVPVTKTINQSSKVLSVSSDTLSKHLKMSLKDSRISVRSGNFSSSKMFSSTQSLKSPFLTKESKKSSSVQNLPSSTSVKNRVTKTCSVRNETTAENCYEKNNPKWAVKSTVAKPSKEITSEKSQVGMRKAGSSMKSRIPLQCGFR